MSTKKQKQLIMIKRKRKLNSKINKLIKCFQNLRELHLKKLPNNHKNNNRV